MGWIWLSVLIGRAGIHKNKRLGNPLNLQRDPVTVLSLKLGLWIPPEVEHASPQQHHTAGRKLAAAGPARRQWATRWPEVGRSREENQPGIVGPGGAASPPPP